MELSRQQTGLFIYMQPATTSSQAMQNLQQFQSGMQTPEQELQKAQQSLGTTAAQQQVTGLRSAINNTTNLLNQVAPSVQGRTQNSLVTSAQATRQIGNEQAPIQGELQKDTSAYNDANQNYAQLEAQAENQANAGIQSQNSQLGYLQNIYNDLYSQEQQQQAQQLAQQQEAERVREFNASLGASTAGNSSLNSELASILGGGTSSNKLTPQMSQRSGGGFNFQDVNGQPISAAKYAQLTNQPLGSVLKSMGQAGDKYSQQLYNELNLILSTGGTIDNRIKQEYSPIFWGT